MPGGGADTPPLPPIPTLAGEAGAGNDPRDQTGSSDPSTTSAIKAPRTKLVTSDSGDAIDTGALNVVKTTALGTAVPCLAPDVAGAIYNVAFTNDCIPRAVVEALGAGSSVPSGWPVVSAETYGPILYVKGHVSDAITEFKLRDKSLTEKHISVASSRSRENWSTITHEQCVAWAFQGIINLSVSPTLTGLATPGAIALHIASGARVHDSIWSSASAAGSVSFRYSPFARSWNSRQSFDIWTGVDFIKSRRFQADLGNHDWTLTKAITWAICLGYLRGGADHVRDGGDHGVSIQFYDACARAPNLCGLTIEPQVTAGVVDKKTPTVVFSGDENMGLYADGFRAYDARTIDHAAIWGGGKDSLDVVHLGLRNLPLLKGLGTTAGLAVVTPAVHPNVNATPVDLGAYLLYLQHAAAALSDVATYIINNPGNTDWIQNGNWTPAALKWEKAITDITYVFHRWSPVLAEVKGYLQRAECFPVAKDGVPLTNVASDTFCEDAANLWRWYSSQIKGTGALSQAIHLAAQLRYAVLKVKTGVLEVSPLFCSKSIKVTVPALSPLILWGVQAELFKGPVVEDTPLLVYPNDIKQTLSAVAGVLTMATDVQRVHAGLSPAYSFLGHSIHPKDLESINQQRTMISEMLRVFNAKANRTMETGGSGFGLWHPQTPSNTMAKTGWAHLVQTDVSEWPHAPLARAGSKPVGLPTGVSPVRIPICFYEYVFQKAYPCSREPLALGDPAWHHGVNPPKRATAELAYGAAVGTAKAVFVTKGVTIDEPNIKQAKMWVGREGLQFWEVSLESLDGLICVEDFPAAIVATGGVAAARRTMVNVPIENLTYGANNPLNIYVARASNPIPAMTDPIFRVELPAELTPFTQPSQTRHTSLANLLVGSME